MPCNTRRIDIQAQLKRLKEIEYLEKMMALGAIKVSVDALGRPKIIGGRIPQGMTDACVLAMIQARNTPEWKKAITLNKLQGRNFVQVHDALHAAGDNGGHK